MILLIDNYDSFTYNLYQYLGRLHPNVRVVRNDAITTDEIAALSPQAIVLSPGPGYPKSAGITLDVIRTFSGKIPILGVCLGHQAIGEAFGGKVVHAKRLMHGKQSDVILDTASPLFKNLPSRVPVARYHSLIVERESLPACLEIISEDFDGQIMALRHRTHATYGVQFHPESILTDCGMNILETFLCEIAGIRITGRHADAVEIPAAERVALKPYLAKVVDGNSLSVDEARQAMDIIMSGGATDSQISAFIVALRMKGETVEEITGFARVMRQKAAVVPNSTDAVDIVGTGGDLSNSFNISTTAAFVIAGAGQEVAKHGNRSVSSKSGAADVLEALGVKIGMTPLQAMHCIQETGLSFLFAQSFHSSMRFAGPARRETGVRTVFNILGPLSNPALTNYIVLGVYDETLLEPMARVLRNLGIRAAMLVHGDDGLDEISISSTTHVCEIRDGELRNYSIDPREYGFTLAQKSDISGGTAEENAEITRAILEGRETGAKRDIVLLNAGCALYTAGRAATIANGVTLARQSIESGAALARLNALRAFTNAL
ncbi:bifunctional anthranilate synthase component II/anthranilate phosphoribosyltransferase [Intestinibacillus massiliensis]|nr:bifunctional anthranilate synthase component II/anthranilate phosphoribosyltransferase [Intestinibacillus massiliensis]